MDAFKEIGFIGLGQIGNPVAKRLVNAGYRVRVYDVRDEALAALAAAGAERMSSAADVAAACDVVLVSLPTPPIVEQVACGEKGILEKPRCRIYIDLSTTGPGVAERVAQTLAARGIATVDAPVSGGVGGAVAGTLSIMTACSAELFEQVKPLLSTIVRCVEQWAKVEVGGKGAASAE